MEGSLSHAPSTFMVDKPKVLGRCPDCARQVLPTRSLVEYQTSDGKAAVWAVCPGCGDVVAPEE